MIHQMNHSVDSLLGSGIGNRSPGGGLDSVLDRCLMMVVALESPRVAGGGSRLSQLNAGAGA
jgi:hypothetical protein